MQQFAQKLAQVVIVVYHQQQRFVIITVAALRLYGGKLRHDIARRYGRLMSCNGVRHVHYRDSHREDGSVPRLAVGSDAASVEFDKRFDERQPYARPIGVLLLHLIKLLEDFLYMLFRNPFAAVGDSECHSVTITGTHKRYASVVRRVLEGI